MKALITLLLVIGTVVVANARPHRVDANSTWQEIYRSGLWPVFPKEQFGSTFVPVLNTCVSGGSLHARVNQCVEYKDMGEGGMQCVRYAEADASKPMTETVEVCVESGGEGSCTKTKTYTRTIATSYEIDVVSFHGEGGERHEFTKHFDIPNCN